MQATTQHVPSDVLSRAAVARTIALSPIEQVFTGAGAYPVSFGFSFAAPLDAAVLQSSLAVALRSFPTLQHYTEGITRMVDAVGVNHVGIGGDLAGIRGGPPYRRFKQFPEIVEMLRGRGFGSEEATKIAGGNFMRVFAAAAAAARPAMSARRQNKLYAR